MKTATRNWLQGLVVNSNNSKAIEVRDHLNHLEGEVKRINLELFNCYYAEASKQGAEHESAREYASNRIKPKQ